MKTPSLNVVYVNDGTELRLDVLLYSSLRLLRSSWTLDSKRRGWALRPLEVKYWGVVLLKFKGKLGAHLSVVYHRQVSLASTVSKCPHRDQPGLLL